MMAWETQILRFLQGPLALLALSVFLAGLIGQSVRLWRRTNAALPPRLKAAADSRDPANGGLRRRWARFLARLRTTAPGASPVLAAVSLVFHVCLFVVPLGIGGHIVLLESTLGTALPALSDRMADLLTLFVLAGGLFFLLRRVLVRRVRVITSWNNVVLLLLALLPFATGILAHHHLVLRYNLMIMLHMVSAELLLVLIPFSKFFHMIFFFFGRFLIVNEYSLGRPRRVWQS